MRLPAQGLLQLKATERVTGVPRSWFPVHRSPFIVQGSGFTVQSCGFRFNVPRIAFQRRS